MRARQSRRLIASDFTILIYIFDLMKSLISWMKNKYKSHSQLNAVRSTAEFANENELLVVHALRQGRKCMLATL